MTAITGSTNVPPARPHPLVWPAAVTLATAALIAAPGAGPATAQPADDQPARFTLTQFDGTPPFADTEPNGSDTGPSNGVVRVGDTVTYVLDIVVGQAALPDAQVTLPIPDGLSPGRVPQFCQPGSALVVDEAGHQSLQCRFGNLTAGTTVTRTVIARADAAVAGTSAAPVIAALSSPALPGPLLAKPVALTYVETPAACDPHGIPDPAGAPVGLALPELVKADGHVTVTVTDPEFVAVPVTITGTDSCGHHIERAVTPTPAGQAVFAGLLPGRYRVVFVPTGPPVPSDAIEVTLDRDHPNAAISLPVGVN